MANTLSNAFWSPPDGGMEVNHFRYQATFRTPTHVHQEYAMIALAEGASEYTQFDTCERLQRGDFLITNGAMLHSSVHALGGVRTEGVAVTLSARSIHEFLSQLGIHRRRPLRQFVLMQKISLPSALPLVDTLVREAEQRRASWGPVVESLAQALVVQVLRAWPPMLIRESDAVKGECMTRQQFIRTLEFMTAKPKHEFSIAALCDSLQLSRAQLYASFAGTVGGTTPAACYNQLLMDRAEAALRSGRHLPVKQIAFDLGFRDLSHFVSSFRRAWGITPAAARSAATPPAARQRACPLGLW